MRVPPPWTPPPPPPPRPIGPSYGEQTERLKALAMLIDAADKMVGGGAGQLRSLASLQALALLGDREARVATGES